MTIKNKSNIESVCHGRKSECFAEGMWLRNQRDMLAVTSFQSQRNQRNLEYMIGNSVVTSEPGT